MVKIWLMISILKAIIFRSHSTGEFHGSQTGSILPSQFQKNDREKTIRPM